MSSDSLSGRTVLSKSTPKTSTVSRTQSSTGASQRRRPVSSFSQSLDTFGGLLRIPASMIPLVFVIPALLALATVSGCYYVSMVAEPRYPSWLVTPPISLLGCGFPESLIYQMGFGLTGVSVHLFERAFVRDLSPLIGFGREGDELWLAQKSSLQYSLWACSIGVFGQGLIHMDADAIHMFAAMDNVSVAKNTTEKHGIGKATVSEIKLDDSINSDTGNSEDSAKHDEEANVGNSDNAGIVGDGYSDAKKHDSNEDSEMIDDRDDAAKNGANEDGDENDVNDENDDENDAKKETEAAKKARKALDKARKLMVEDFSPSFQSQVHQMIAAIFFVGAMFHGMTCIKAYFACSTGPLSHIAQKSAYFKVGCMALPMLFQASAFMLHPIWFSFGSSQPSQLEESASRFNRGGISQWLTVFGYLLFFASYAYDYAYVKARCMTPATGSVQTQGSKKLD